jgi:hypothetical protein
VSGGGNAATVRNVPDFYGVIDCDNKATEGVSLLLDLPLSTMRSWIFGNKGAAENEEEGQQGTRAAGMAPAASNQNPGPETTRS